MVYVYALLLEMGKVYVGKTSNPKVRLGTHFATGGSYWTVKYKPVNVLEIVEGDDFDEDKLVLQYMNEYGIDNVRGGSFSQAKLSKDDRNVISKMINGAGNKCYKCGGDGHFGKYCKKKVNSYDTDHDNPKVYACSYCGKEFDTYKGAIFHENRYCKEVVEVEIDSDTESDEQYAYACAYCGKEFDTYKGAIFHENRYCKRKSCAKTNQQRQSGPKPCGKCGRIGHFYKDCYAKTTVDGKYIRT